MIDRLERHASIPPRLPPPSSKHRKMGWDGATGIRKHVGGNFSEGAHTLPWTTNRGGQLNAPLLRTGIQYSALDTKRAVCSLPCSITHHTFTATSPINSPRSVQRPGTACRGILSAGLRGWACGHGNTIKAGGPVLWDRVLYLDRHRIHDQ